MLKSGTAETEDVAKITEKSESFMMKKDNE